MINSTFTKAPSNINISRTKFPRHFDRKMTLIAGQLYPCFVDEVVPGDTFKLDTNILCRMSTPIHPVMDNCYLDIAFFYVPYRVIWPNFTKFMGEPPEDPYIDETPLSVPQLKPSIQASSMNYNTTVPKTVFDYMGLPTRANVDDVSALPFRAFAKIWNDWYMGETVMQPIDIPTDDADHIMFTTGFGDDIHLEDNPEAYITTTAIGGYLPPVAKYHDYFTSALIDAQRGEDVAIPLNGFAPVMAYNNQGGIAALRMYDTSIPDDVSDAYGALSVDAGDVVMGDGSNVNFTNVYANLSGIGKNNVSALDAYATINDLRYAFATQQLLEKDNLYGTRYTELLYGHYGVSAPNGLLQRSEYLGGKQIPINISSVAQTSESSENSPQGNLAAFSLSTDSSPSFVKSFVEHGVVIGTVCIRQEHSYQQGVNRMFDRKDRLDFFWPSFENVGDQPIYGKEIYNGTVDDMTPSATNELRRYQNSVFGYQERYAEYKYHPSEVCGEFRSNYPGGSLDVWHYADYYTEPVYLSSEWLRETRVNIDRTLAVSSDVSDQFILDIYYKLECTRPMHKYARPGGLYSRM